MGTMYDDYVFLDETDNFDDILVSYERLKVRKKSFNCLYGIKLCLVPKQEQGHACCNLDLFSAGKFDLLLLLF